MLQCQDGVDTENYDDLVRLLIPEQLVEDFQHINEVEEQLRRQLNQFCRRDPSQSPIWIMSHEDESIRKNAKP